MIIYCLENKYHEYEKIRFVFVDISQVVKCLRNVNTENEKVKLRKIVKDSSTVSSID